MHDQPVVVPSLTPTQRQLMAIWADILPETGIGLDESFLELGGDSVTAVLCVNRIRKELAVEVPMNELLAGRSTIRALAAAIDDAMFPASNSSSL